MHRFAAALFAAALMAAPAAAQQAEEPGPAALAFARQFSDDHLSGMLSRIGGRSEALRALAEFDGQVVATVFDAQIDAAVRQYGDEWARNMALAWAPLLSEAEMASLVEQAAKSPFADKYVASREAAAAAMAERSADLFGQVLQEVVADTIATLTPEATDAGTPATPIAGTKASDPETPASGTPASETPETATPEAAPAAGTSEAGASEPETPAK